MIYVRFSPEWFFGYDVLLEMSFAIISLIVAGLAFAIFKKTSQPRIKYFGAAFLLVGISYLIQSILNFLIITEMNQSICQAVKIQSIEIFNTYGLLIHMLFMIIGYSILLFTTIKTENTKTMWLLILISIVAIFFSNNIILMFYLFSTLYLSFIAMHYITNYLNNKRTNTLIIAIAFLFLLFGSFHFLVSVNHQLFYAIGHILELFAYLLILTNFYLVLKK